MTYLEHVIQYGPTGQLHRLPTGQYDEEIYDPGLIRVDEPQIRSLNNLLSGIWPGAEIYFVPNLKNHEGEQIPGTAYLDESGFRLIVSLAELNVKALRAVI